MVILDNIRNGGIDPGNNWHSIEHGLQYAIRQTFTMESGEQHDV